MRIARVLATVVLFGALPAFQGGDRPEVDPPSRVGRLSYLGGSVSFRPGDADDWAAATVNYPRSEEHTSELQSLAYLVCRLLLEKKKRTNHVKPVPHESTQPRLVQLRHMANLHAIHRAVLSVVATQYHDSHVALSTRRCHTFRTS